jgi:hypothetical protein
MSHEQKNCSQYQKMVRFSAATQADMSCDRRKTLIVQGTSTLKRTVHRQG